MATKNTSALSQKKALFLSAPKFAVVGASTNASKNGSKALKWLIEQHKDVVPINPKASEIQGIKCMKTLSELPDPTHTAVSVVVRPEVTLEILQQAKALGIFALWLQPGAEDDAVIKFIQADAQLDERCIYRTHALHEHTPSRTRSKPEPLSTSTNLPVNAASNLVENPMAAGPIELVGGPCIFATVPVVETKAANVASEPESSVAAAPAAAAPLVPSNIVAGGKREMLSPPSTPPVTKSLKLTPDDSDTTFKIGEPIPNLGQEIPGLA
ncbi:CoA binding domain-containing protein [Mycena epipterygia]|nr:CoA binding domain-containing protein [Mycena epipterygia]